MDDTRRVLLLIALLLPALAIAACIGYFGVDSPHWDEWNCEGNVSRAYLESRPLLSQLASFCNESRPFFPKILWLATSIATRNSRVAEMYLGWLFVCLTVWNLYHLNGRQLAPTAMMSVMLFHPVQHENWLWGSQNMLFVPALCLTSMLRWSRFAFVWPVIATYSFANGMLLWPALFAVLLKQRRPLSTFGVAIVLLLLFVPVYFIGFERAPAGTAAGPVVSQPIHYVLTFLGAPLAGGRSTIAAAWIGLAWLGLIGLCSLLAVLHHKVKAGSTWWILGGYGLASAVLAAWGRSHLGVTQALENRYTAFSIWLAVAAIGLAYHVAWPLVSGHRGLRWTVLVCGFGLFGTLYASSYPKAIREHNNRSIAGRYQRTCLHFFEVLPGGNCTGNYPVWTLDYLRTAAPPLNRGGWIRPPLATTTQLPVTTNSPSASGSVAITGGSAETGWKLQGMAGGDPDAVILAVQRSGKEWEAVEVLPVGRGWVWNPEGVWSAELQPGTWTSGTKAGVFLYKASSGTSGPLAEVDLP